MCGIIGVASTKPSVDKLLIGLLRQEYRGYDSAGLAIFDSADQIQIFKSTGKVAELQNSIDQNPVNGNVGIAHTRWATHGLPTENNAHPHHSNKNVFVIHNGIIENHQEIRTTLKALGYVFESETDTEVIAHLIHAKMSQEEVPLVEALQLAVKDLRGAYAIGAVCETEPGIIAAARKGSPLVVGIGHEENFIASDQLALADFAENFVFLEEGDLAEITPSGTKFWNLNDEEVERPVVVAKSLGETVDKGEYRHFMLKEINEQPEKIKDLLEGQLTDTGVQEEIFGPTAPEIFKEVKAVQIVACGTSFHAGTVAKYWLEGLAGLPCSVEVASEFRYRNKVVAPKTLFVTISQSGETADTLACLSAAKDAGYLACLGICNVPSSSLARESDLVFLTKAGPEIGVASTKAFTTQLVGLLMLTLILGRYHGLSSAAENAINNSLRALPKSLDAVMELEDQI
ncbi:MAG: glutamine--fructose-6-phosphate transaminase (isomerizing), partial [Gammaproteobacteria bacterium]